MKLIKISSILALSLFAMVSCQKENVSPEASGFAKGDAESRKIQDFLENELKIDAKDIRENEQNFIVENCIEFPKENFWTDYGQKSSDDAKHYKYQYKISPTGTAYVSISSTVPAAWATAVRSGIANWNGQNRPVKFAEYLYPYPTIGIGLISVSWENLGNTTDFASGNLPSLTGKPGAKIRINSAYVGTWTTSQRNKTMTHELGHNMGFGHTDNSTQGASYSVMSIPYNSYTCTNNTDASSMMKQGKMNFAFTTCDKEAFKVLYP